MWRIMFVDTQWTKLTCFALTSQLEPWPAYIQERIDLFDKLKLEADAELAGEHAISSVLYSNFLKEFPLSLFEHTACMVRTCCVTKAKYRWNKSRFKFSSWMFPMPTCMSMHTSIFPCPFVPSNPNPHVAINVLWHVWMGPFGECRTGKHWFLLGNIADSMY